MRRILALITILALTAAFAFALAEEEEDGIAGTWEMIRLYAEGRTVDNPRASGSSKTVTFNEDGTAVVTINKKVYYGSWEQDGDGIELLYEDGDRARFAVEGNQLIYRPSDQVQYFEKQVIFADASDFSYRVQADGTAMIIGYSGDAAALNIPDQLDGYPVRVIGPSAFASNGSLVRVTIPQGVETIRTFAFKGCAKLYRVKIPNTVREIGISAFEDCEGLSGVTLPDALRVIRCGTFAGCKRLRSVQIPSSVRSIEMLAFRGCEGLTGITIPEGVETIADGAFMNCSGLAEASLPSSLTAIYGSPFRGCGKGLKLSVPSGSYAASFFAR